MTKSELETKERSEADASPQLKPLLGGVPFELDDEVRFIFGRPNFTCGAIARILRKAGVECAEKAEDEQATVIYWMLGLYLEHGEDWRTVAEAKLREMDAT